MVPNMMMMTITEALNEHFTLWMSKMVEHVKPTKLHVRGTA